TENVTVTTVVKGRAQSISLLWHGAEVVHLVNVYAPSTQTDQPEFWEEFARSFEANELPQPHFMLGDFNVVEADIDRLPARMDDTRAAAALYGVKMDLGLQDTWRQTFETRREFTFFSTQQSASRIDRIYANETAAEAIFGWKMCRTIVGTDHCMVSVKYAPTSAPLIGKGRWTLGHASLSDVALFSAIADRGKEVQRAMESLRESGDQRGNHNVQTVWEDFKRWLRETARKKEKANIGKVKSAVNTLDKALRKLGDDPRLDANPDGAAQAALL
ncbi:DNase I-like protein, partial [Punctularia strigosozonata HHB-11173 SS5]|uniref:DNase I-like protein n=1 Tax=Punctularia strigosozonata (strain HHB-11173) TaxID=741275 RepID=UPI0004416819